MILYHGSNIVVQEPRVLVPNRSLDFGAGFYTTSDYEQAERWAQLTAKRRRCGEAIVSAYEVNADDLITLDVLDFQLPDKYWLKFVAANRIGNYTGRFYDVVYGPVANDRTMSVINDFISGNIDIDTALILLKPQNLSNQYCFKTEDSIRTLVFSEVVEL